MYSHNYDTYTKHDWLDRDHVKYWMHILLARSRQEMN